ncbi:hypothetical protein BT96DRAFT_1063050 [Gymnopus androsaceus JB14]|uniref:Uncharacterized protein n=1 Tax=Gymnopus androsaceus JB14 TaxID=1447944 RepID=A0A6A4H127_9AGAR|nr:hypothetical protein BT96DRAFT_1063050 [Gymnopus androsaceus JB14]
MEEQLIPYGIGTVCGSRSIRVDSGAWGQGTGSGMTFIYHFSQYNRLAMQVDYYNSIRALPENEALERRRMTDKKQTSLQSSQQQAEFLPGVLVNGFGTYLQAARNDRLTAYQIQGPKAYKLGSGASSFPSFGKKRSKSKVKGSEQASGSWKMFLQDSTVGVVYRRNRKQPIQCSQQLSVLILKISIHA